MACLLNHLKNQENTLEEIPIAALITDKNGNHLTLAHNSTITDHDPTSHAEINAIRALGLQSQNYRHPSTTIYITHEPCPMCFYAIMQARVSRIVFGSIDHKIGILSQEQYKINHHNTNHHFTWTAGVMQNKCTKVLKDFFEKKRILRD